MSVILQGLGSVLLVTQGYGAADTPPDPDPPAGTGSPPTEIGVGRARIGIGF